MNITTPFINNGEVNFPEHNRHVLVWGLRVAAKALFDEGQPRGVVVRYIGRLAHCCRVPLTECIRGIR